MTRLLILFLCLPCVASPLLDRMKELRVAPTTTLVRLGWDYPTNIVTFNAYWRTNSSFNQMTSVGTNKTVTISNLLLRTTYRFAATAVNTIGLESDYSNVIEWNSTNRVVLPTIIQVQGIGMKQFSLDFKLWANLGTNQTYSFTNPVGNWFFRGTNITIKKIQ